MNDISYPLILYHYTSIPAFKNIVRKRQFWLTHYKDVKNNNELLKDDNELLLGVRIVEESLAKKFSKPGMINNQFRNISQVAPKDSYIGCFCHRNDNDYLWENYARGGVVIGFDTKYWLQQSTVALTPVIYNQNNFKTLCANIVEQHLNPIDAIYEPQLKEIAYTKDITKYKEGLHAIPEYLNTRDGAATLAVLGTIVKDPGYKPEEEWRLVHDPGIEQRLSYAELNGQRRAIFNFGLTQLPIISLDFMDSDEEIRRKGLYNFLVSNGFHHRRKLES